MSGKQNAIFYESCKQIDDQIDSNRCGLDVITAPTIIRHLIYLTVIQRSIDHSINQSAMSSDVISIAQQPE